MKYIIYKRFKEKALCGQVNLPALTECKEHNGIIYFENKPLCCITSENAHSYFAINEDDKGLERGVIIQKIINTLRRKDENYQKRWDKVWEDEKSQKYKRQEHPNHWLWNHDFYNANIEDLVYILNLIREVE